jgi:hypothetical protein
MAVELDVPRPDTTDAGTCAAALRPDTGPALPGRSGVLGAVAPAVRLGVDLALVTLLVVALVASVAALRMVWHVATAVLGIPA